MASNEHFVYVGPHRGIPDLSTVYEEFIEQSRDAVQFEGARKPEGEELKLIREVQAGMLAVATEAGIPPDVLRARLTKPQHHHLFPDKETYVRGVRGRWPNEYEGNGGKSHAQVGVMWRWRGKPNEDGTGIAHEEWHDVGLQRVRPVIASSEVVDGVTHDTIDINVAAGYTDLTPENPDGNGIEEFVVEMSTDKTIHLIGLGEPLFGFAPLDAVGDAAIMKAVRDNKIDPRELANMLIRGRVVGDMTGLRILGRSLGQPAMRAFVHSGGNIPREQAKELAERMGLPEAIEMLESDEQGKGFPVFSWHTKGKSSPSSATTIVAPADLPVQHTTESVPSAGLISNTVAEVVAALRLSLESKDGVEDAVQTTERAISALEPVAEGSEEATHVLQQLYAIREGLQSTGDNLTHATREITHYLRTLNAQS